MTSYATEHARSRTPSPSRDQGPPRRPDLSTFFTTLSEISTQPDRVREHAVPVPGDVSAAYRSLAEAFEVMRRDIDRQGPSEGEGGGDGELLQGMIEALLGAAERPPREVEGVDEEYIAQLDRVDIKKVDKEKDCPICGNAFHDGMYILTILLHSHVLDHPILLSSYVNAGLGGLPEELERKLVAIQSASNLRLQLLVHKCPSVHMPSETTSLVLFSLD